MSVSTQTNACRGNGTSTSQQHGKGKRYDTADLDGDETVNLIERTLFL
ncbi:MAG: hypothetical protein IPO58_22020 [Betaproteobacteria bacterium]|nr:hypothetical protein [Betaproteobacteria bacterium]